MKYTFRDHLKEHGPLSYALIILGIIISSTGVVIRHTSSDPHLEFMIAGAVLVILGIMETHRKYYRRK